MLTCDRLAHRVGLAIGLPVLLATLAAAPAAAESGNGYGYLRTVEGSATLLQAESEVRTPAEINQPVLAGDRLIVPQRSKVEIILADRNLLRIDGGSEVVLERLAASPEESRERATVLRLLEGNIQLVVLEDSLGEELPRIETPNATIFVQDFGVYRLTADQEVFTQLLVREGKAEIHTDRRSEAVRADQQAFVEGDSRIDVEPAGSSDSLERWARRLDEEGDVDSRYVGEDLRYAAAPLSRHGSWVDYEGAHYWRPRNVAADWRPYWQGRWAHTPAGMNWVSYEPWGWVTSHYGSWDYIPTYGWAWRPGRTWAPAWVYWYWGPSYTGWCPTGYYTRYYGSRWGHNTGFHSGVYGWAGGDWGHFNNWTFVPANYFRGYRKGYRDGYWDGRRDGRWEDWRERRNVGRYAVPVDQIGRRGGALERGIVTTDTRPLTPDALDDPRRAVRVLSDQPTARRIGARGERGSGELPDVTGFVARQPELPTGVRRVVVADGPSDTLGRGGETARRATPRGGQPGEPGSDGVSSRPRIVIGDGDRPTSRPTDRPTARQSTPAADGTTGSTGGVVRSPRAGRTAQGEPGGAARPERPDRPEDRGGVRVLPRDTDGGQTGGVVRSPRTEPRTTPSEPGGAPRPDRGVRSVPRATPRDNDGGGSTGANPGSTGRSPRMGTRQTPGEPGGAPRPDRGTPRSGTTYRSADPEQYRPIEPRVHRPTDPSGDRGTSSRPSTGSRRPEPRPTRPEATPGPSGNRNDSPSPRMSTPRYERPSPPSSSRGGYERPASPPSRSEPRTESRQAPRPRSEAPSAGSRQAPERRPSVDRGSSSRGSSEGSRGGSSGGSSRRAERSRGSGGRDN
jgi:hypothetical protein